MIVKFWTQENIPGLQEMQNTTLPSLLGLGGYLQWEWAWLEEGTSGCPRRKRHSITNIVLVKFSKVPGLGPSNQCGRRRQSGPGRLNSPVVLLEPTAPSEDLGPIQVSGSSRVASPSTGHQNCHKPYVYACISMCKHMSVCIHVNSVSSSCCIYSNDFYYITYII